MKILNISVCALLLLSATAAHAQIHIPVADLALEVPSGAPGVTLQLGSTSRNVLLTPFYINNLAGQTPVASSISSVPLWFCMDPLQTIFYNGSGSPYTNAGSDLIYQSQNPANFDNWNPASPTGGLTTLEKQYLANIFSVWAPSRSDPSLAESLQLAVWEIVTENLDHVVDSTHTYNLSTGNFKITSASTSVIQNAQYILDHVTYQTGDVSRLSYLIDGAYTTSNCTVVDVQDLVGWSPPIPESSNFATGALGLLSLAVIAKLRRQKTSGKFPAIAPAHCV